MEFLQKFHNHLVFIMKFAKVLDSSKKKRAFKNDGLFHIIYVEESTNFLGHFEDS